MIGKYTKLVNNFAEVFLKLFGVSLDELYNMKKNIERDGGVATKIIIPEFKIFGLPIEFSKDKKEVRIEFKKH